MTDYAPAGTSGSTIDQQMTADVQTYEDACEAYEKANDTYQTDMDEFNSLAAEDPSAAIIFFITVCAPDFLSASEANINVYSTQMNISNDMRSFETDATNQLNTGQNMTATEAQNFENDINDLQAWTDYLDGTSSGSPFNPNATDPYKDSKYLAPIDATNGASISSDCTAIKNEFKTYNSDGTVKSDDWDDSTKVAKDISKWFTIAPYSDGSDISTYQEAPQVKALQESLQEINSSVSTLSSSQQTTFQYYLGNYNQCTSIFNSLETSTIDGEKTMITNQKAQ